MGIVGFGLLLIYGYGVWRFINHFHRTQYQRTLPTKIVLALLWPACYAVNASYRRNFNKTLSGGD
jgi:hypothetical protein